MIFWLFFLGGGGTARRALPGKFELLAPAGVINMKGVYLTQWLKKKVDEGEVTRGELPSHTAHWTLRGRHVDIFEPLQ